jgi:hypothetical protein
VTLPPAREPLIGEAGKVAMLVDTAAPALELIEMYRRWGYEPCGECDWRPLTNYMSVLMRRPLAPAVAS